MPTIRGWDGDPTRADGRRAASRFGLALGIGVSSMAGALGGALLVLHALPVSSPVETVAAAGAHQPVDTIPDVPAPVDTSAPSTTARAAPSPPPTSPTPQAPVPPAPAPPPSPAHPVVVATAAAAVVSGGAFAFEQRSPDGSPARWDPCTPIHYVVNLTDAPPTAAADVAGAIARVSAATGIGFVADGITDEEPSRSRPNEEPARYGHRWAPLLIAWIHGASSDFITTDGALGEGGATWVAPAGGPDVYVTGQVAISADTTRNLPAGFGAGATIGLLLLHELGHVVGLAHVTDPAEVMYPRLQPRDAAAYGPGDLAGLAALGHARGCDPAPAAL